MTSRDEATWTASIREALSLDGIDDETIAIEHSQAIAEKYFGKPTTADDYRERAAWFRELASYHSWAARQHELTRAATSPIAAAEWAWGATRLIATDDAEAREVRREIVGTVLRDPKDAAELATAPDAHAEAELERDLLHTVDTMRERCGLDGPAPSTDAEACALDGALPFADARFAAFLEPMGKRGAEAARKLRERSAARATAGGAALWGLWTDRATSPAGFRWAVLLARVVWADVTAPRLRQRAALVRPVYQDVTRLHSRTFEAVTRNGQAQLRFDDDAPPVELVAPANLPTFEAGTLEPLLRRGLDKLGSITGHKVLRHEVNEGHARYMRGDPDPRSLRFEGGWSALADVLGLASNQGPSDVRAIVYAQAHCRFALPNGSHGNLLSYTERSGHRGQTALVTIALGDPLLPSFVQSFDPRTLAGRDARRLVPLLDLPPLVGRTNEHGAQATLSMLLAATFRDRVRELLEHEGVRLTLPDLQGLAERAGLPRDAAGLAAIVDRWTQDGTDAPALLRRVGPDRYTLGAAHRAALDFMLDGGRRELGGESAGKASARKRASTLTRKAGTRRRGSKGTAG